jgi:hypothetical protein
MQTRARVVISSLTLSLIAGLGSAQPVLITVPTTVGPTDTTIGGVPLATAQITVRGTTLTMSGRRTIDSLRLERDAGNQPAVLTHPANARFDYSGGAGTDVVSGLDLTVTGRVIIEGASGLLVGSRIDVTGRGFPGRTGPGTTEYFGGGGGGGAGHGGAGSDGTNRVGGTTYGSFFAPSTFGSGGTGNCCSNAGAGGGRVRINATSMQLDGDVIADAEAPVPGVQAGGGAGGSIALIATSSIGGNGSIRANGGAGIDALWGSGGGGRVAITADALSNPDRATAHGGAALGDRLRGGAGTVHLAITGSPTTLIIDNGGIIGENTEFTGSVSLPTTITRNGGVIGPAHQDATLNISITGSLTVGPASGFSADGRGFPQRSGPGTVSYGGGGGGHGAGHGGAGSDGTGNSPFGDCYDSITVPDLMGSGGSGNCCSNGGAGGGRLRVSVTGQVINNGFFSADAQPPQANVQAGGGAGGTIRLNCGPLSGSGVFRARGASGIDAAWGAGGGGRISINHVGSSFPNANYDASGGVNAPGGRLNGGAGTVFIQRQTTRGLLIIDNKASVFGEATELSGIVNLNADMLIDNGGYLAPKLGDATLDLILTGNATIGALGKAGADARGFLQRQGPGTVGYGGGGGGNGASHAGAGSEGSGTASRATTYGNIFFPRDMGSGATGNCCSNGGTGGGAFKLTCGNLIVNGQISADAEAPIPIVRTGGGAGGSILINAQAFSGTGNISARGAAGPDAAWGAGGGGRVAIYHTTSTFPLANISAAGGPIGASPGGAGTVFLKPSATRGTIYIDNAGLIDSEVTEMQGQQSWDANLVIDNGAILGHAPGDPTLEILLTGTVTIGPGGILGNDFRGYPQRQGPGAVNYGGGGGGNGASFGGLGGRGSGSAPLTAVYGEPSNPDDMGSGGSGNCCAFGGAGGGLVRLTSGGAMVVNGRVSVNGESGSPGNGGGGSGGGILLNVPSLSGGGLIRANGGQGFDGQWGSGGGGRIAIFSCNVSLPLSNITASGGFNANPIAAGQNGSVFFGSSSITISQQPTPAQRAIGTIQLTVVASSTLSPTLSYQWRRRTLSGSFVPLANGGAFSGVTTSTLTISDAGCDEAGFYDCLITDSCGSFPSNPAQLSLPLEYDYNQDENVDLSDAQDMARVVAGLISPEPNWLDGDINGDENFDLTDAQQLANYVVSGECPF